MVRWIRKRHEWWGMLLLPLLLLWLPGAPAVAEQIGFDGRGTNEGDPLDGLDHDDDGDGHDDIEDNHGTTLGPGGDSWLSWSDNDGRKRVLIVDFVGNIPVFRIVVLEKIQTPQED